MSRFAVMILSIVCLCHAQPEARPNIPIGVKYRFIEDAQLSAARSFVAAHFASGRLGVAELLSAECMCAPGFWRLVPQKGIKGESRPSFSIPNARTGITYKLEGAHLESPGDLRVISDYLADAIGTKPTLRRLTAVELEKFWIAIPFDIEEPVFAVSGGKRAFVVCLKPAGEQKWRIWWIDALSEYDYGESFQGPKPK